MKVTCVDNYGGLEDFLTIGKTYKVIEDENDEYNIEAFISFGLAKKVMKKIDEKLLNEVYEELEKEVKETSIDMLEEKI